MLLTAALLCFLLALAHSYLGERFLLIPLLRSQALERIYGDWAWFARRTLRFAWHITTLLAWGFAFVLWRMAAGGVDPEPLFLRTTAAVFFLSGSLALGFTKGRHLSWIVFWGIAGLVLAVVW
jgi:hypothetical protein